MPVDIHTTDLGGVRVFWTETSLPFLGAITVRMGRVDETLLTSGMSHLLEHLVLDPQWPVDDFNATVYPLYTYFWFSGQRSEVLSRIVATTRAMASPPLGRVPRERAILRTEAYGRGRSQPAFHASARYGPRGLGLMDYPELGLRRATRTAVLDWSSRFFTAGNVAITLTEPPPEDLVPALREGPTVAPPSVEPLALVDYPSSSVEGPDGSAGVSMLVERSDAARVAVEVVEHRLRQWLRHEQGVTYHVGAAYEPLNGDRAHVTIWADCLPSSGAMVRNAFVAVLDDVASNGATAEELERSIEFARRRASEPNVAYDCLFYEAANYLVGLPPDTPEASVVARENLRPADIAEAVAEGFTSLIVCGPERTPQLGGRFKPYPSRATLEVKGKRYSPADERPPATLVVGGSAVSFESGDYRTAVRYDDAVAFLTWDDGSTGIYGGDGFYVVVDPADWKKGSKAADEVRRHVDATLVVDMSSEPPEFEDPDLVAAQQAHQGKNWKLAATSLRRGLKHEPDSAEGWRMLAWAAHQLDERNEAIVAAREASRLDPHDPWAPRFLASLLRDAGQLTAAVVGARQALRRAPVDLAAMAIGADVVAQAGFAEEAEQIGRRATELYPDDSRSWFAYGWAARSAGNWEVAEAALRRAVELAPDVSMWHNNLGVLLLDIGEPRRALDEFDHAYRLDSENRFVPTNRAAALHLLGKTGEAQSVRREYLEARVRAAAAAVDATPGDPVKLEDLARALLRAERDEEARSRCREALAHETTASRLLVVAAASEWLEDWSAARDAVDAARRLAPDDPEVLDEVIWLAAVTGDAEAAREGADRLELLAGKDRALPGRVQAAVAAGAFPEAERLADALIRRRPRSCCALAWRGRSRLGQGRRREAEADAAAVRAVTPARCISLRVLELELA